MAFVNRNLFSEEPENKPTIYSVAEVCRLIQKMFNDNALMSNISIEGEISNLTYHSSGNIYFTLKDEKSSGSYTETISAYFPKDSFSNQAKPQLKDGMKIGCRGKMGIFPAHGKYQITVYEVWQIGKGDLMQKFLMLTEKLKAEGLFDPQTKKKIPLYPKKFALITSLTGAVIHDIARTLRNRNVKVEVVVIQCIMQGEKSADSVIQGIETAHNEAGVEFIMIARGGGSFEDLNSFNDEQLARAAFKSKLPIVSAIGHETDRCILDFVADMRASTPTQAAQLLPDSSKLYLELEEEWQKLNTRIKENIRYQRQNLDHTDLQMSNFIQKKVQTEINNVKVLTLNLSNLIHKPILEQKNILNQFKINLKNQITNPIKNNLLEINSLEKNLQVLSEQLIRSEDERLENLERDLHLSIQIANSQASQEINQLEKDLQYLIQVCYNQSSKEVEQLEKELKHLNPENILERGYSLTLKEGKIVTSAFEIQAGDKIENVFKDGRKQSEVL